MSRKERFTPQEKEQACIDYIEGNRSRSEICRELYISTSTMNIPVRRVLPHENIQMVGLTTTELSNKTSNNWLNGIASCQYKPAPQKEPSKTMLFFMLAPHNKPSNRLANPQKLWIPLLVTTHKRSQRLIPTGSLYYSFCLLHCIFG